MFHLPFRLLTVGLLAISAPVAILASLGQRFPSEKKNLMDPKTGVELTALTNTTDNNNKIYQTHPQWTADGKFIIFRSNRGVAKNAPKAGGKGPGNAFAVDEKSGEIIQLTDEPFVNIDSLNVSRNKMALWFTRGAGEGADLIELDLGRLLADSAANKMAAAASYQRLVATLPSNLKMQGGFAIDADESCAYMSVARDGEQQKGGVYRIELKDGEIKMLIDTPYQTGHVQTNPDVPGMVLYCHETGGDAPQRMFLIKGDGSNNRPLYHEAEEEAITHEVFVNKSTVGFIISGLLPSSRLKPNGVAMINLESGESQLYGQIPGSRFWHVAVTHDLSWICGDNSDGEIFLINPATGQRKLLTQGHKPNQNPTHPHMNFSKDGTRLLFGSGMLGGTNLMTVAVKPTQDQMAKSQ